MNKVEIKKAIDELAMLKDYWSLLAETDPVELLRQVKKEIIDLRVKIKILKRNNKDTIKDTIKELSILYFSKTGNSPKLSFYSWLDAMGIEPSEKAWKNILRNHEDYEFE